MIENIELKKLDEERVHAKTIHEKEISMKKEDIIKLSDIYKKKIKLKIK